MYFGFYRIRYIRSTEPVRPMSAGIQNAIYTGKMSFVLVVELVSAASKPTDGSQGKLFFFSQPLIYLTWNGPSQIKRDEESCPDMLPVR